MCNQKPFIFGMPAANEYFIGREKEVKRLAANFTNGINTILISPRRYGKTSLVKHVAQMVNSAEVKVVYLDAFACRSEYDFYNQLSAAVLQQTSTKIDEWRQTAADFLSRLMPKISFSPDPSQEISLSLGITPKTHTPESVLALPQQIAEKQNCHIVVCIDEFQQVGEFPDSLTVQKRMRTVWQHHNRVSYCVFGSKKHLMNTMFQSRSYPFFKFGDMIFLESIPAETWIPFLRRQFAKEGKTLPDAIARKICETVGCNSQYVQQLAYLTLLNTDNVTTEADFEASVSDLLVENEMLFISQTEKLTTFQLNFLRAIKSGVRKDFGLAAVRDEYGLGSASNINRLKTALIEREIIDFNADGYDFADPVMKIWFGRKQYFSNR